MIIQKALHSQVNIRIAKWIIQVFSQDEGLIHRLTRHYQEFLYDGSPDMEIILTPQKGEYIGDMDVSFDGNKAIFEAPAYHGEIDAETFTGRLKYSYRDPFIGADYFLRVATGLLVFRKGGLLFHAAGIERDDDAYVFVGHSGAGKTTIARNSPPESVLNDDLLVLSSDNTDWWVSATPFYNPTQVTPRAGTALLKAMFFLVQAKRVHLEKPSKAEALAKMVANVPVLTANSMYANAILMRCGDILNHCDAFLLHFLPDSSFWHAIEQYYQNCRVL